MAGERILVVDDEKELAEIVRDYLAADGVSVEICADGRRALDRFIAFQPHCVVLDLMIPGSDGMEICRQIRGRSSVPIVILSAKTAETDKVLGLGLGADDYVTKPFSPGELVARLKAQIRRSYRLSGEAAGPRETLRFPGLEIDCASRTVRRSGSDVELSAREFDLLCFLARHPRQVFSREQLFDRVWGEDRFGDISTVTVHVSRLRDKLEEDPSRPLFIRTVWGAGYRFDAGGA